MIKKNFILIFLTISFSMVNATNKQWVSFQDGGINPKSPNINILSSDSKSIVVDVNIEGVLCSDLKTQRGIFQQFDLLTGDFTREIGKPSIPYISFNIAIPDDASVSYEILNIDNFKVFNEVLLPPSRSSWEEGAQEKEYETCIEAYKSNSLIPVKPVHIGSPVIMRDFRALRISVFPAQYNALKKQLKIAKRITLKINFGDGTTTNVKRSLKRKISPSFGSIYNKTLLNYQQVLENEYNGKEDGKEVLLIITPDEFYSSLLDYCEWKKQSGYEVIITKFRDIGATNTNPSIIYDYIASLYSDLVYPPTYVLLVGDSSIFPYKIAVYSDYSFPDEDFFAKVDGDDFIPDLFVGRLTPQTVTELKIILNKIIKYEKFPYIPQSGTFDDNWFRKGICCSNCAYESQVLTKEYTADVMINDGDFILVDQYMSDGYWSGDCTYSNTDVIEAINNGRSFLNYRGEGWYYGWNAYCTPLQVEDLGQIDNGEKLTFVTSIGCGVAMFNSIHGNCFGETWLQMGTETEIKGAVNFIGPTSNTHTTYNNYLDKGIYIGIFTDGLWTPGQALFKGKQHMYDHFGDSDFRVEYHYRVYCDLGDPSTRIWKKLPKNVVVTHPQHIELNNEPFKVTLKYSDTEQPVVNANVNLLGDYYYINAKTNELGEADFSFNHIHNDMVKITVTGDDVIPGESIMEVGSGSGTTELINNYDYNIGSIPNPFAKSTEIIFTLSQPMRIDIEIYTIQGALMRTFHKDYAMPGEKSIIWDGKTQEGMDAGTGIFLCRIAFANVMKTMRIIKTQ